MILMIRYVFCMFWIKYRSDSSLILLLKLSGIFEISKLREHFCKSNVIFVARRLWIARPRRSDCLCIKSLKW